MYTSTSLNDYFFILKSCNKSILFEIDPFGGYSAPKILSIKLDGAASSEQSKLHRHPNWFTASKISILTTVLTTVRQLKRDAKIMFVSDCN